jgi:hypothetical protein
VGISILIYQPDKGKFKFSKQMSKRFLLFLKLLKNPNQVRVRAYKALQKY